MGNTYIGLEKKTKNLYIYFFRLAGRVGLF